METFKAQAVEIAGEICKLVKKIKKAKTGEAIDSVAIQITRQDWASRGRVSEATIKILKRVRARLKTQTGN